jgi:small subunit ribosomal protein S8
MKQVLQDSISRISNGQRHGLVQVELIYSKLILSFLKCLYNEGFIRGFCLNKSSITLYLKYYNGIPSINHISSVSKLSKRVYISKKEVVNLMNKKELFILSTSQGITTTKNILNSDFQGGEVLCRIY